MIGTDHTLQLLLEQLAAAKRRRFGRSSEKHENAKQIIFMEVSRKTIHALEAAHDTPERKGDPGRFIAFIAEAETETEKDFIRAMGLTMPNFREELRKMEEEQER